jgi:hypothetical protein
MGDNDDYWDEDTWDELLGHIGQQTLVPVVGPGLAVAKVDNAEQTLTTLIGQRLAERFQLTLSPGMTTMGDAVGAFLRQRGRDETMRLYGEIYRFIVKLDPTPGQALRDLAAIADLRLFVSTTPDRLLAKALNDERFQGRQQTRELSFSPSLSTSRQLPNEQALKETDTAILNLFGKAANTPDYAIHDEDKLEWLHALLSDEASDPGWLIRLKRQPMLFIGCEIPDWIGRFLVRMSSNSRLWDDNKQFFFAGCSPSNEPSLASFFETYCRKAQIQQNKMAPTKFVAELRKRWGEQRPPHPYPDPPPPRSAPEIFISYLREDGEAAGRLRDAIDDLGGNVWMDKDRISPGDAWRDETLTAIRRAHLFIPVISANTEREHEGYVHEEWHVAIDRARKILGRHFIVPVVVDEDYEGDPSRFQMIPPGFTDFHFGRAPAGHPDAHLIRMLTHEIRAMRRHPAA